MECSLCQSPLAEGATVCGACGADVPADAPEATTLSGSRGPDTTGGPPRGEVLAERWEIEERISADALMSRYRAHDQETEARVVLTLIAPDLVPSVRERTTVKERLAAAVGIGNKYLPGLLDADREGTFVFAVEPLLVGSSLRSVLDARRTRGETMHVAEVLPVVAQLAAALSGIAPPHHHGDVRAERVIIGPEGLRLVGPFVLPALPAAAVTRALASDDAWRRVRAPEMLHGAGGDAADRYGVAAIAFEALTGRLPDASSTQQRAPWLSGALEPVDEALRALLAPEPAARPRSLDALVEALAECAHLPVPDLDPAVFRRIRRASPARAAAADSVPPDAATVVVAASLLAPTAPAAETPASAAFDAGPFDTSPFSPVDADATSRMQALNADGELEPMRPAPISAYPDLPDLATDPGGMMPTATEPPRATQILAPDALPPAYRLDESATLAESSLQTRRVVPLAAAHAAMIAAAAKSPAAPAKPALAAPTAARLPSAPSKPASTPPRPASTPPRPAATAPASPPTASEQAPMARARPIAGAAAGGTQEIAMDDVFDALPAKPKRADDSLDPRLVRAALGVSVDDEEEPETGTPVRAKKREDDSLDPRLVRAALGIALDASDEGGEPPTKMRPAASPRTKKSSADTQQLTSDDLAEMSAAAGRRSARVTSNTAAPDARRKRDAEPVKVVKIPRYDVAKRAGAPRAPAPARPAGPPAKPGVIAGTVPLPADARRARHEPITHDTPALPPPSASPSRHPAAPGSVRPSARPVPLRAPIASAEDLATPAPRTSNGRAVIWISVALALAIVCVGAGIAWWRNAAAEAYERERHLQERFQQLRQHP